VCSSEIFADILNYFPYRVLFSTKSTISVTAHFAKTSKIDIFFVKQSSQLQYSYNRTVICLYICNTTNRKFNYCTGLIDDYCTTWNKQCSEFSYVKFYLVQFSYAAINARQGVRKPTCQCQGSTAPKHIPEWNERRVCNAASSTCHIQITVSRGQVTLKQGLQLCRKQTSIRDSSVWG